MSAEIMTRIDTLKHENDALRREIERLRAFERLAYRDPLTGLWNRRYLEERLAEEIDRLRRQPAGTFGVLVIDVDDFKDVNDTHGHAAGDETLVRIARFLEENLRDHDVSCRTGGDEFTVILPGADGPGAALLAARLQDALERENATRPWPISLSIGVANWPGSGASVGKLLEAADQAMYRDKARRKRRAAEPRSRVMNTLPFSGAALRVE